MLVVDLVLQHRAVPRKSLDLAADPLIPFLHQLSRFTRAVRLRTRPVDVYLLFFTFSRDCSAIDVRSSSIPISKDPDRRIVSAFVNKR